MFYLKLFKSVLQVMGLVAQHLHDNKMMDAGANRVILESLKKAEDETENAIFAGEHAAIRFDNSNGLPNDKDPNLRD